MVKLMVTISYGEGVLMSSVRTLRRANLCCICKGEVSGDVS